MTARQNLKPMPYFNLRSIPNWFIYDKREFRFPIKCGKVLEMFTELVSTQPPIHWKDISNGSLSNLLPFYLFKFKKTPFRKRI